MTVAARKSESRKYVVCGACAKSLCRIDRVEWPDGRIEHRLSWGDGWIVAGDHIEMRDSAIDRLQAGHKPGRKDWANAARLDLSRALQAFIPAVCPRCGALNEIKPRPLKIDGIASYK